MTPSLPSSHTIAPHVTVREILQTSLRGNLRARLTNAAAAEFQILTDCIAEVTITGSADRRLMIHPVNAPFTSSGAYSILHSDDANEPDAMRIWNTKLPIKVKFFGWLLFYGRLNTRAHLHYRGIRALEDSMCEHCANELETDDHLFLRCPRARAVWDRLLIDIVGLTPRTPWLFGVSAPLPDQVHIDMILLTLWHIWKARNALIFDRADQTSTVTIRRVAQDCEAWKHRYPTDKLHVERWRDFFLSKI